MNDAAISVFNTKYTYNLLRPISYIRNVMGHTTWNTVVTTPSQFQDYYWSQGEAWERLALVRMLQSRSIHIPFLFLTALGKQTDRIEGLSLGADDYLVKPFDLQELVLRIENITRRNGTTTIVDKDIFDSHGIRVDLVAHLVTRDGIQVDLSPKEYELLECLIRNR